MFGSTGDCSSCSGGSSGSNAHLSLDIDDSSRSTAHCSLPTGDFSLPIDETDHTSAQGATHSDQSKHSCGDSNALPPHSSSPLATAKSGTVAAFMSRVMQQDRRTYEVFYNTPYSLHGNGCGSFSTFHDDFKAAITVVLGATLKVAGDADSFLVASGYNP